MQERKSREITLYNAILILLLVLSVAASIVLYRIQREGAVLQTVKPQYHFYFIGQNAVDPFWKEIRLGVEQAAEDFNVAVEVNAPRFNNPQEALMYLDIAILSQVDGIITHGAGGEDFTAYINRACGQGIPVVTIESDAADSNRSTFVGTNGFLLGKEAAGLMLAATREKANIAIIVSSDIEKDTVGENLKLNGFLSTLKDYPEMQVVEIFSSQMGILSAEEITQRILQDYPQVDAILTTNSVDTLGAAQVIVDQNRVGQVTLVGHGDTPNILRYIRNRIIYGTVMSDPYRMGYESVKALVDIKTENHASTFIDTGVKVIIHENLDAYENKLHIREW